LAVPTAFALAGAAGVPAYVLTKEYYLGSALSVMFHAGARMGGYVAASDFGVRLREIIARRERKLVFAYWDALDTLCHRYGTEGEEFLAEVETFDSVFERQVLRTAKDVTILLTADHGHINTYAKGRIDLRARPDLLNRLAVPPTGEPRLTYLHAADGNAKRLRDEVAASLGDSARVCTANEAFDAGLFGGGIEHPAARARVGDVLAAPKRDKTLIYGYPGEKVDMIGRHGGLSPAEMLVPLVVARR